MAAVAYQWGVSQRGGLQLTPSALVDGIGREAASFEGGGEWLNSEKLELDKLMEEKKVVLVDFWTYSCINCQRTIPYLQDWWKKYMDRGLVIVGVHAPEFEFEKDKDNVLMAMAKYGVTWPVVQDNEMKIWKAYNNRFWPAKYLIVPPGRVIYSHFGEGAYMETESVIRNELEKLGYDLTGIELGGEAQIGQVIGQSPETYLGWQRGTFGNMEKIVINEFNDYGMAGILVRDRVYFEGEWLVGPEFAVAGESAGVRYLFRAGEINLVMGSESGEGKEVKVYVDDRLIKTVIVREKDLYNLYDGEVVSGELRLDFERGIEAYAFTFGG